MKLLPEEAVVLILSEAADFTVVGFKFWVLFIGPPLNVGSSLSMEILLLMQ